MEEYASDEEIPNSDDEEEEEDQNGAEEGGENEQIEMSDCRDPPKSDEEESEEKQPKVKKIYSGSAMNRKQQKDKKKGKKLANQKAPIEAEEPPSEVELTDSEDERAVAQAGKGNKKRGLKANAKKQIKKVHQKKGHELKAERELKRKNKSATLKAVHSFCEDYMIDKWKDVFDAVSDKEMYKTNKEVQNLAFKELKAYPKDIK